MTYPVGTRIALVVRGEEATGTVVGEPVAVGGWTPTYTVRLDDDHGDEWYAAEEEIIGKVPDSLRRDELEAWLAE